MKLAVFSSQSYDQHFLNAAAASLAPALRLTHHIFPLSEETVALAAGADAVCVFVNDTLDRPVLTALAAAGTKCVLLRCAGYNNVDLAAADALGIAVSNVPAYSPEAVAEFTIALILTLNRKTHRAYSRVREGNFSLDGLLGFNLHRKTVGIVGTGNIGVATARILAGFGCRLLAYDPYESQAFKDLGGTYAPLDALLRESDIVTLHCPLTPATHHIISASTLALLKPGAMLVNCSRGALIDTAAVIAALKQRRLGALALDVYESEANLFYKDRSSEVIDDDVFQRLMTFPNVLVAGHQGFFTQEACREIAETTIRSFEDWRQGTPSNSAVIVC
ncbi:D-lactate dehydrogenase [Earliella scabrosa]|nr:D-lactate dehydrogenase [Earliella scabrosa]